MPGRHEPERRDITNAVCIGLVGGALVGLIIVLLLRAAGVPL